MAEIQAKARLTFHQLVEGKSSYTHIRYSNDGVNFTPASPEALEKAIDWPIEGRNLFVCNNVFEKNVSHKNAINQLTTIGRLSNVIHQNTDKKFLRMSAEVVLDGCTFYPNNLCSIQGNGRVYGWLSSTRAYKVGTGENRTYIYDAIIAIAYNQAQAGQQVPIATRIDYIEGGTITYRNVKIEYVNSLTDQGTPYSPSPEDAAIGTTVGRWRGEMVSDSPIASVNFSDYTWTKVANDTIYLRGTGMNRNANGIVRINGVDIVNGWWSGLRMLTFDRNTLEKKSDWIAVYANSSDQSTLANKLNALDDSVFVALVSCDALSFNPNVVNALQAFGAKELPPTFSARVPFVFFSYRGAPEALSMVSGTAATDPYAEVSTYIAERTFIIGKKGDKGTDGNDGVSVTSIKVQYYLSTSKTAQESGSWSDTPPKWESGKYLWTRMVTTFSNGTSTTSPAVADSSWEAVELTEVGGSNLFGFRNGVKLDVSSNAEVKFEPSFNGIRIRVHSAMINPTNPILVRVRNLGFERSGYYTVSFRVKSNRTMAANTLNVNICDLGLKSFAPSAAEQRIVTTANVTKHYQATGYNGFVDFELNAGKTLNAGDVIEISDLMIERGRIPSDYRMAEEDATYMQRLLEDTLQLEEVTIGSSKGVSYSGRFDACEKVNGQQVVRSFLNGLTNGTRPAFAAGVEEFGETNERYATALYHNGSGHLGGLNFSKSKETGKPLLYVADGNGVERVNFSGEAMPTIEQLASRATEIGTIPVTTLSVSAQNDSGYFDAAQATASPSFRTKRATGTLRGRFRLTKSGTNHAPCALTLVLRRKGDHYRQYVMTLGQITAGVTTSEFNIDKLVNLAPEEEYDLALVLSGFDAFNATGTLTMLSPLTYTQTNQDPFVGIFADGLMAYHSPQQWTRVQNGVVESKGGNNPIVLACGYVDANGGIVSKSGHVTNVVRKSTGEYLIYHTIGHTDYAIIISPIGNGKIMAGQLAAQTDQLAWCYIKDLETRNANGGLSMVNTPFTFAIIGRQ